MTGRATSADAPAVGSIPGGPLRSVVDQTRAVPDTFGSYRLSARSRRNISDDTGGVALAFRPAVDGLREIDQGTRSGYLLGYWPTNSAPDGRYRRIEVSVRRQDVRVFARQGYFARGSFLALDPESVRLHSRLVAASYSRNIPDINVRVNVPRSTRSDVLTVDMTINPSRVTFASGGGRHTSQLDILVLCSDGAEQLVGQLSRRLDLAFTDQEMKQVARQDLRLELTVPVSGQVRSIKAIVYDPGSDRLGSITVDRR